MSDIKIDDRMPVLVGCGQLVQKEKDVEKAKSPMHLRADAAEAAAADTGLGKKLWDVVDNVTTVRFITPARRGSTPNRFATDSRLSPWM